MTCRLRVRVTVVQPFGDHSVPRTEAEIPDRYRGRVRPKHERQVFAVFAHLDHSGLLGHAYPKTDGAGRVQNLGRGHGNHGRESAKTHVRPSEFRVK